MCYWIWYFYTFFFHETSLSWFLCFSSGFLLVSVRSVRSHLMVSLVLSADSKASLALWVLCGFYWQLIGLTEVKHQVSKKEALLYLGLPWQEVWCVQLSRNWVMFDSEDMDSPSVCLSSPQTILWGFVVLLPWSWPQSSIISVLLAVRDAETFTAFKTWLALFDSYL